jgi:hypothetical protein
MCETRTLLLIVHDGRSRDGLPSRLVHNPFLGFRAERLKWHGQAATYYVKEEPPAGWHHLCLEGSHSVEHFFTDPPPAA